MRACVPRWSVGCEAGRAGGKWGRAGGVPGRPARLRTHSLTCPTQSGADFEVVNVLDEIYNPGLREAIKSYSAWPTIPQVGCV